MSGVEFEEDNDFHIRSRSLMFGAPTTPTMVTFLLKRGWVKNEKQALYVLLFIAVLFLGSAFGFYYQTNINSYDTLVNLKDGTQITVEEYIVGLKSGLYKP